MQGIPEPVLVTPLVIKYIHLTFKCQIFFYYHMVFRTEV